ncbi:MAG: hypothetical protein J5J00_16860 [Deltaproteobacteria bacterium]|nr:hypothetical protein [Deltaproteobacteria bacterium]
MPAKGLSPKLRISIKIILASFILSGYKCVANTYYTPQLMGDGYPNAINNNQLIVGTVKYPNESACFVWESIGGRTEMQRHVNGTTIFSDCRALNNQNAIAGIFRSSIGLTDYTATAIDTTADGTAYFLDHQPATFSDAVAINDTGDVVGQRIFFSLKNSPSEIFRWNPWRSEAQYITNPEGVRYEVADINNSGTMVGTTEHLVVPRRYNAFFIEAGSNEPVHLKGDFASCWATDVSEYGSILGFINKSGNTPREPVVWDADGNIYPLPIPSEQFGSSPVVSALDINAMDQVVGSVNYQPVIWKVVTEADGTARYVIESLGARIDASPDLQGYRVGEARSINDKGDIAAIACPDVEPFFCSIFSPGVKAVFLKARTVWSAVPD